MIGIIFNEQGKVKLIHNKPDTVNINFDMLVESLPEKDETKSDMLARLYKDDDDNLYWEYKEKPAEKEKELENRITDLEMIIADLIGGTEE